MSKAFKISLVTPEQDFPDVEENVIRDLFRSPHDFWEKKAYHAIFLLCRPKMGINKDDSEFRRGEMYFYFDHQGKVVTDYIGINTTSYLILTDKDSETEERFEVADFHGGEPLSFKTNQLLPTEFALPFVLEFCEHGLIDLDLNQWEKWQL